MDATPEPPAESTTSVDAAPGPPPGAPPAAPSAADLLERAADMGGLNTLALVLVVVATSLYLLERLEPVLRPLLIAVLLCYLFLPLYHRLRRRTSAMVAFLLISVGFTVGALGIGRMIYHDVATLDQNRPRYQEREAELERLARATAARLIPGADPRPAEGAEVEPEVSLTAELSQRLVRGAASAFVSIGLESIVIAFYMIFLLQSAAGLPGRIRASFSSDRAGRIMEIVETINRAISDYLRVKVQASLMVALPVWGLCEAFGVTGGATWGVLTFFGNFLPYIGPLIAIIPPLAIALVEFPIIWPPLAFGAVLLAIHGVTSNLIEPAMTGKALGLNPLVVLVGLAFWSLLWGFVGMVLAVPLTVIFKIVLEHTPATRPIARLISEQDSL
ncbi:AI-2E family transporter [Paludisphaera sp.]|uniref:AI-2E family transporter n=1 Tax=Paludisphaera sp. TaxID=2017432 RepID=UPI00301E08DA